MEKKLMKYFWVIILLTLAIVAFFLASGTNELAAGTIAELMPPAQSSNAASQSPLHSASPTRIANGDIILERNIFDSTGTVIEEIDDIDPAEEPVNNGEMQLVQCSISGVKLLASIASDRDPEWSFANVDVNGEKKLYRMGDEISGRTVSGISWRYLMLKGTSDECYIDMFDQDGTIKKPPAARPAPVAAATEVSKGISVDGEFERTVDRSIVDQALANPTKFAQDVRVRPYKQNGEVVGFRLRRVQPGSAIEQLGAQRGDVLHSVNGIELKSVDDALTAYQKLRSDNQLSFSVTRRGKPVELKINID